MIRKGSKVKILEGEFKNEEGLIVAFYHWGLIGVLIFDGKIPRKLLW